MVLWPNIGHSTNDPYTFRNSLCTVLSLFIHAIDDRLRSERTKDRTYDA